MRNFSSTDSVICLFDNFLKTLSGNLSGTGRRNPGDYITGKDLSKAEKLLSGKLMRVNHAGEVAAQALYQGQLLFEKNSHTVDYFNKAAEEEADHLIWTSSEIKKLDSHESYLNSLWYLGAFLLGVSASLSGEKKSLGFLAETERQVANHLSNHLKILPDTDKSSRLVVETMLQDETKHALWAEQSEGFTKLPKVFKNYMQRGAKIMVSFSHKI
jgi:ubiquinone biosynthesis monooxygenase Coq7